MTVDTGGVTVGGLTFNTTGYTVSGDPITFGAAGNIAVNTTATQVATISSDVTGAFGLSKTGTGILRMPAATYTFTGNISVAGGTLDFSSASNDSVNRTLGGGNFPGDIDIATGATFQFWRNTGTQEFSGDISGGGNLRLAYRGNYILSGDNTYTGKTTVHGEFNGSTATLNVSSFNSVASGSIETGMGPVATPVASSSLGAPTNATNGTVDVGRTAMQASAILNYTGLGETTDRVINLVSSGNNQRKGVSNLGTGTLTFTSPWIGNNALFNRIPITTDADMILQGFSLPDNFQAMEKFGNAKLSLSGPCTVWNYVHLHGGTLEVDSEINDGGVHINLAIQTGAGNGGTNFIGVPAGTPLEVGMSVLHGRLPTGTTITAIVDINADPVVAQISSNSDTTNRTENGSIGFAGALGIIPATPGTSAGLRWVNSATLKYDGPDDSTNRGFIIDAGDTATWEIIGGSTLEVSGATTNTTGGITKTGAGTLVLSGDLLHDGVNNVNVGTLLINGDSSGMTGAVNVNNTAILGGSGTIGGSVDVGSTAGVAPGASAGTLTIAGDLDISALAGSGGGTLDFELDTPGASDQIAADTLTIGTDLLRFTDFTFSDLGGLTDGTYVLITTTSGISTSIDAANASGAVGGGTGTLGINGNNLELVVTGIGGGNPFDTWAATGTLGPVTFGGDTNGDGVQDGIAFLLGVANPDDDATGSLPTESESGGDLVLTFNCLPGAGRGTAELRVAHSNTLASWTPTTDQVPDADDAVPDNDVTFVVDTVTEAPLNKVTATINSAAAGEGKLFGRLEGSE